MLLFDDCLVTQMILSRPKPKVRQLYPSGACPVPQNVPLYFGLSILTGSSAYSAFVLTDIFTVQMSVWPPFPVLTFLSRQFYFLILHDFSHDVVRLT